MTERERWELIAERRFQAASLCPNSDLGLACKRIAELEEEARKAFDLGQSARQAQNDETIRGLEKRIAELEEEMDDWHESANKAER